GNRKMKIENFQFPDCAVQRSESKWQVRAAYGSVAFVVGVADHINYHGAGEHEDIVFSLGNVHAIGIGPGKPAVRNLSHRLAAAGESVLHVQKVALSLEVIRAGHVHGEAAAEKREQLFL